MRAMRGAWLLPICAMACGDVPAEQHPPTQTLTFGELVFRVVRTNLVAASTCSLEYVAGLEPHHVDFVRSFDYALAENIRNDVPDLLGNTIVPVVANGTLPGLVDCAGQALKMLVDDQFDPERKTLTSMVSLANAPTLVESAMVTNLAAGAVASPNLAQVLHSTRLLMQEHDGVDVVMNDVLGLVTHGDALAANTCTGLVLDDVQGTLLRSDGFVDDPQYALGAPAWMVRPDVHGNPRVLVDTATSQLASPFVDLDGNGAADVGPTGRPVDEYGQLIDLPYLGTSGTRDTQGRALNRHGGLLYDYYDVKRTPLSFSMQIAADFLAADIHHAIPAIADAVLGQPVTCSDGTTTCRAYAATDHPLADLTHLGLELVRFSKMSKLMDVLHQLFETDADKAEDLLVAAGDVIAALQSSTISLTDTAMYDALIGIVPLIRQIFGTSNTTGKSTPHLLVDLIASMSSAEKAQIEQSLGWMVEYKSLTSRPNPTPNGPLVDYTRNRFYQSGTTWIDNRSGLEQAVELLSYADCGFIGCSRGTFSTSCAAATALNGSFGDPDDGTVSEWLLGAMSSKSPQTVSTLITVIDWLNNFSIPFVCNGAGCALEALGCSSARADDAAAHIPALKTLASSGGLDWLLPIARVFDEQHQMPALVDIFVYVADDLWKSGEHDRKLDSAASFVRRLEPPILSSIKAGAVVKLLAALDVLHGIQAAGTNERATHLLVDTLDYAIQLRTVNARRGAIASSSIATELLKTTRTISARVDTANADAALSSVVGFGTKYLTATTTLPSGRRVLAHPNMRMMAAVALDTFADLSALPPADQACYVDYFQRSSATFLTGRNFATIVRLAKHVISSPNAAPVEDYLVSLLRANAGGGVEAYGPILQLTAAAASADIAGDDLANVAAWLQGVAKDQQSTAMTTLVALDDMVQSDTNGTMVQILRNLVGPGPATDNAAPVSVFADTFADVVAVDTGNACEIRQVVTVPIMEKAVTSLADFLLDDQYGITSIWKLVGTLAPH